ncbi:DUF692 domain-containing protein [Colwellia psychrerythraea]|uniref:DUF692 domain-containing protein n=1 Tax=Colwellia psychrerythraea TaxID=28229 RepID=A0A099KBB5_COLPS|nr:DUF692 domain-containing protein [Colwellia psychrerythraea]KGJ86903.1 protein of unknown function DUF692 [Colwellia psychrerythraea]
MSLQKPDQDANSAILIGVGLRHQHFTEALTTPSNIDFVEVHSENFFAKGGAALSVLAQASKKYAISLHSTAMGLGSAQGVPSHYLQKLNQLASTCNPILMSDHACFSWGQLNGQQVHAGDLLPLAYSEQTLMVLAHNIDRVQQSLGRSLLVENLSAYIQYSHACMPETEFLTRLTELTGCKLLVDLNNIIVTANNINAAQPLSYAQQWLAEIPTDLVGEIHLAGYTEVNEGELIIDDHSQAISNQGWQLYRYALERFGKVPTLVEWDNNLPSWQTLVAEADKARAIAGQVFDDDALSKINMTTKELEGEFTHE